MTNEHIQRKALRELHHAYDRLINTFDEGVQVEHEKKCRIVMHLHKKMRLVDSIVTGGKDCEQGK